MATVYKTPGVYVEEIPKLPPSVAQVATAIPAFIGYTEKAEKDKTGIVGVPTEVNSFLEFESWFGGAYEYEAGDLEIRLDEANLYAVSEVRFTGKLYYLYDSVRLFYDNGGGQCYIVSAGLYADDNCNNGVLISPTDLSNALAQVEKYDKPTILVIPDAVNLEEAAFYPLQQAMITQCAKLQDRFAVLDLGENGTSGVKEAAQQFRDSIGISNLKYAAAYAPWLVTAYSKKIPFALFRDKENIKTKDGSTEIDLAKDITSDADLNGIVSKAASTSKDLETIIEKTNEVMGTSASLKDRYNTLRSAVLLANAAGTADAFDKLVGFVREVAGIFPFWRADTDKKFTNPDLINTLDAMAADPAAGLHKFVKDLIAFENNAIITQLVSDPDYTAYQDMPDPGLNSWLRVDDVTNTTDTPLTPDGVPPGIAPLATVFGTIASDGEKRDAILESLANVDAIINGLVSFAANIEEAAETYDKLAENALYANHPVISGIVKAIKTEISKLPPSGAIAGIYARVDDARGVWKAPANESINSVIQPLEMITAQDQEDFNVDTVAGKSINAIRSFSGKGTLVWGARTLAGNDNEWRYVSVRRFFNMVEESCKKATEPFVFEPNDANTWIKVQGMIENFLTVLWRQGALQGAKTEHAFYVAVGLGKTMTALDILEGRMIVEIGMAVVRPAEFIILRFSHKMAES